jgi:hypothetical protein
MNYIGLKSFTVKEIKFLCIFILLYLIFIYKSYRYIKILKMHHH